MSSYLNKEVEKEKPNPSVRDLEKCLSKKERFEVSLACNPCKCMDVFKIKHNFYQHIFFTYLKLGSHPPFYNYNTIIFIEINKRK